MKHKHLAMIMGVMITATSVGSAAQYLQQTARQRALRMQATPQKIQQRHQIQKNQMKSLEK